MGIRDFWQRLVDRGGAFAQADAPSRQEAQALLTGYLESHADKADHWLSTTAKNFPLTPELEAASPEIQLLVLLAVANRLCGTNDFSPRYGSSQALFNQFMRRKLPHSDASLCALIDCAVKASRYFMPVGALIGQVEKYVDGGEPSEELAQALGRLHVAVLSVYADAGERRNADKIKRILLGEEEVPLLNLGDAWAKRAMQSLLKLDPKARKPWEDLLRHASGAIQAKPSKKWNTEARKLIDDIGIAPLHAFLEECVSAVGEPGTREPNRSLGEVFDPTMMHEKNADVLRGLVWCFAGEDGAPYARTIGELADRCYHKIPEIGARCAKVGNACVYAFGQMPPPHGVSELSRLRTRIKLPSIRATIEKALQAASAKAGISTDDLEEMSTPTFGMSADGVLRVAMGEHTAELAVVAGGKTELSWVTSAGKRQKSVPKQVKDNYNDELKALRKKAKDIQKTLATIRDRLERAPIEQRVWSLDDWRKRLIDHPLAATLARRLIWNFEVEGKTSAAFHTDDGLMTCDGATLNPVDGCTVTLWHPVHASSDDVRTWRVWLEAKEITQPFKQAHREIYILTPAEEETDVYSNRFAAHILKQHQLNALAQQRGWVTGIYGGFDSHNTPTISLPKWNMKAEFWLEWVDGGTEGLSDHGIALYVSTDQVRFVTSDGEPVRVCDVPKIVFSEVMRDVDLFVGVSSVGNDPNWVDQGNRPGIDYWSTYAFGDLSESAKTRQDILSRLLPKLKIAKHCELIDRFLVVKGSLRTYKIHLGSGNILMLPNDQYLCIVPARGTKGADKFYLPFEGDGMLSVILSKAFLLVDDKKIKDPQIVAQLSHK
ncbi:MAG TPA: DUF4132 domain-containing protein [Phycisphaerae bacterium]|nr:DUF4132 domain-containing protein [Phycisphaerae bacterium]